MNEKEKDHQSLEKMRNEVQEGHEKNIKLLEVNEITNISFRAFIDYIWHFQNNSHSLVYSLYADKSSVLKAHDSSGTRHL